MSSTDHGGGKRRAANQRPPFCAGRLSWRRRTAGTTASVMRFARSFVQSISAVRPRHHLMAEPRLKARHKGPAAVPAAM